MGERPRRTATAEPLEARRLLSAVAAVMRAEPAEVADSGMTAAPAFAAGTNGPVGFTPAEIRAAYGISAVSFNGVAGVGTGQTVAIVVAYNNPDLVSSTDPTFASSDLAKFDAAEGIANPPSLTKVGQSGSQTALPEDDPTGGGWADETALDVEWVHATAPAANILLVECNSDTLDDLIAGGVQYARQQPKVSVVSMSFASPEAATETQYDQYFATPAGHIGVTFVAAAGDGGAPAEYPAASPSVVGVGGTTAAIYGSTYSSEVGLSNGGGGVSGYEPKPIYQSGLTQSATHRATPDVAFEANHNANGNVIYDSFNGGPADPWYAVGGTSFATAVWSGLISIANQGRGRLGLGPMDSATQTLPRLYYLGQSDFHDVTSGNNGNAAGTGYDLVTGRGTPIANKLVPDLAGGGSVAGEVFQDNNSNGTLNSGEAGVAGATVYLDLYGTGARSGADPVVTTNSAGAYSIGDLPGGTYRLETVGLTSYTKTSPAYSTITIGYGSAATGQNVGEHLDLGTISGYDFVDTNLNQKRDGGEAGLAGWSLFLDLNNNGIDDGSDVQTTTNSSGFYQFSGLRLGTTYYIREGVPAGYSRTTLAGGAAAAVPLFSAATLNIGYVPNTGTISGHVFNDANGNGVQDAGDTPLVNWGVYLDVNHNGQYDPGVDPFTATDANGNFTFTGLPPGDYVLNQQVPAGYRRTAVGTAGYAVGVPTGAAETGYVFGNEPI